MIKSTKGEFATALAAGRCPVALQTIRRVVERKLGYLDAAATLDDLRRPPGNRLEQLRGDRADLYSIRINNRYRICFRWEKSHAFDVEVIDYH